MIRTILVADDNEVTRGILKDLLTDEGFNVVEAGDGEECIELTGAHQPDLIIMDIQMPKMDGLTATRLIRSRPEMSSIPVIAFTGYAMEHDRQSALDAGCSGFLTKPVDTRTLVDIIEYHLEDAGD